MDDLIAALTIFRKYGNPYNPTYCSHDKLTVCVEPDKVSLDDKDALEKLGFHANDIEECFYSFRFGSA